MQAMSSPDAPRGGGWALPCPVCATPVTPGPAPCPTCGLPAAGQAASVVARIGATISELTRDRDALLATLRTTARGAGVAAAAMPPPAPASVPVPPPAAGMAVPAGYPADPPAGAATAAQPAAGAARTRCAARRGRGDHLRRRRL